MLELETNLSGGRLRAERERARRALGDLGALHRRIGVALESWVQDNVRARGRLHDDFPGGWPPLARATLAARRRAGQGTRPLQATGRLRRSIAARASAGQVVLHADVPYAATHQLGLGVPRRAFFPGPAQLERIVLPVAQAHVREALA